MKKLIALFLSLAFMLSPIAPAALAENVALPGGYIEGDTYFNTDGGFKFKCPDDWKFDTAKEIAKNNGISADELGSADVINKLLADGKDVSAMTASDSAFGIPCSVTMAYKAISDETAEAIKEFGEEAFLDQSLEVSDTSFSQKGVSVKNVQLVRHTFLGKEIPVMEFTISILFGIVSRQVDLAIFIRNDKIYTVAAVSTGDGLKYLDAFGEI